jgi:hypothetical protein
LGPLPVFLCHIEKKKNKNRFVNFFEENLIKAEGKLELPYFIPKMRKHQNTFFSIR